MTDEDRAKVKVIQDFKTHLGAFQERWPLELEMIRIRAKLAKARYDALRKEGFSVTEALTLCTKQIEI